MENDVIYFSMRTVVALMTPRNTGRITYTTEIILENWTGKHPIVYAFDNLQSGAKKGCYAY